MGYERTFRLAVSGCFGPEEKEKLKKLLKTDEMKYKFVFNERVKWYDFVNDIKLLSKSFPNTIFYGAYVGEDLQDNEYVIFHRGCSMPNPDTFAFKLPSNDKVIKMTRQVQENRKFLPSYSDSDTDYDSEEELEDQLNEEREKLVESFFLSMNLTEISDFFDLEDED